MSRKAAKSYSIVGRTVNKDTGEGVDNLVVEAWDKDLLIDDLVGTALTDEEGNFRIKFGTSSFNDFFLDRDPDLFFKVFRGKELITSTEDEILWNLKDWDNEIVIEIAEKSPG